MCTDDQAAGGRGGDCHGAAVGPHGRRAAARHRVPAEPRHQVRPLRLHLRADGAGACAGWATSSSRGAERWLGRSGTSCRGLGCSRFPGGLAHVSMVGCQAPAGHWKQEVDASCITGGVTETACGTARRQVYFVFSGLCVLVGATTTHGLGGQLRHALPKQAGDELAQGWRFFQPFQCALPAPLLLRIYCPCMALQMALAGGAAPPLHATGTCICASRPVPCSMHHERCMQTTRAAFPGDDCC